MAESSGRERDRHEARPTLEDFIPTTKSKKVKKKKRRKHSKDEKEHADEDNALGNEGEGMDCCESGSHEPSKGSKRKLGLSKTKESQPREDGKGRQDDLECKSDPVDQEGKNEPVETMDWEGQGSRELEGAAEGSQSQPESKDVQTQDDGKHSDDAHKRSKSDSAALAEQKDQHPKPMDCTNSTADVDINEEQMKTAPADSGASGKSLRQSRWDQPPKSTESAIAHGEQNDQHSKPMDCTDSTTNVGEEQNKSAPADPSASGKSSRQSQKQSDQRLPSKGEETPSNIGDSKHTVEAKPVRDEHGGDQGWEQPHKRRNQRREPSGRREQAQGRHPSDEKSVGRDGESQRGRRPWKRDRGRDHSDKDQRSSGNDRRLDLNWRKDGREFSQKGGGSEGHFRRSSGDRPDRNAPEDQQSSRKRNEERPKYTVGTAPDGKERFAFFFRPESPFSQWHFCNFTVHGKTFVCAEQFMMYRKASKWMSV